MSIKAGSAVRFFYDQMFNCISLCAALDNKLFGHLSSIMVLTGIWNIYLFHPRRFPALLLAESCMPTLDLYHCHSKLIFRDNRKESKKKLPKCRFWCHLLVGKIIEKGTCKRVLCTLSRIIQLTGSEVNQIINVTICYWWF